MPKNNVTDLITDQDTQEQLRFSVGRDKVLARLWDIANMDPERTRNSMSAQVKAISMIVAIEGLIPDRKTNRAVSAQNQSAPPPTQPPFYVSACARTPHPAESVHPQPPPAPQPEEAQQEGPDSKQQSAPGRVDDPPPPGPDPILDFSASSPASLDASQTTSSPLSRSSWVPDSRVPFSIDKDRFGGKNGFGRRR